MECPAPNVSVTSLGFTLKQLNKLQDFCDCANSTEFYPWALNVQIWPTSALQTHSQTHHFVSICSGETYSSHLQYTVLSWAAWLFCRIFFFSYWHFAGLLDIYVIYLIPYYLYSDTSKLTSNLSLFLFRLSHLSYHPISPVESLLAVLISLHTLTHMKAVIFNFLSMGDDKEECMKRESVELGKGI